MHTSQGIALDAWVDVDGDCPIHGEVVGQQAQIELGHSTGSLHLVLTEQGLANLARVLTVTLTNMRPVGGRSVSCIDPHSADPNP